MSHDIQLKKVKLSKFVNGGQCIGSVIGDEEGKIIFVWGGLPGEKVNVRLVKKKSSYLEGIVTEVIEPSKDRCTALEPDSYLSTSPWQIVSADSESKYKQLILEETFYREKIKGIKFEDFVSPSLTHESKSDSGFFGYRNKMEFGFWGDDKGIHLAHFIRGTHGKTIVKGSVLADQKINEAATSLIKSINRLSKFGLKATDLKTVIFRSSRDGQVVCALFVKNKIATDFSKLELSTVVKGLNVYFSNPKSPASVPTDLIYSFGDINLTDVLLGQNITYDVLSFFQVNIPMFEQVLEKIKKYVSTSESVDFYSGVGSIGIPLGSQALIELDLTNVIKAKNNVKGRSIKVIHSSSESALKYITNKISLIVDPPRSGLHKRLIDHINTILPPLVIYLSCNPVTQARDVKALEENYDIIFAQGYNFFPRTPHIECLVILRIKQKSK